MIPPEKIISTVLVVVAAAALLWTVMSFVNDRGGAKSLTGSAEDFLRAVADELPDKCKTPEGYTDSEWQEHMSHHPSRYAECLAGSVAGTAQEAAAYQHLTPEELFGMLADKDFTLIDVHIPEQAHIAGTDAFIPYNEVVARKDELPRDKSAKIVLYCRSGSMSRQAAETLAGMGYTNVFNLEGGTNAWRAGGYPLQAGKL